MGDVINVAGNKTLEEDKSNYLRFYLVVFCESQVSAMTYNFFFSVTAFSRSHIGLISSRISDSVSVLGFPDTFCKSVQND